MDFLSINVNTDVLRKIIKGHLVSAHGHTMTPELSDSLSKIITESIDDFLSNVSQEEMQSNDLTNK